MSVAAGVAACTGTPVIVAGSDTSETSDDGDGDETRGTEGPGTDETSADTGDGPGEFGDAIERVAVGFGSEIVAVEFDGKYLYSCGGFGAQIEDVTEPEDPDGAGSVTARCQNVAIGARTHDTRVVYFAHHGDSWVPAPRLTTARMTNTGPETLDVIQDASLLFEGLAWRDDLLYVTVHDAGLRIYETDVEGVPSLAGTVAGFDNAVEIELVGDHAMIADGASGLRVVNVADPTGPYIENLVPTVGMARDLAVEGERLYVAMGGSGVEVFDVSDPVEPTSVLHIESDGSVQALDVEDGVLASANWSHVAAWDALTGQLLATQKTRSGEEFEQNLAIRFVGERLFVGEWENTHHFRWVPGVVAPEIWVAQQALGFDPSAPDAKVVLVENKGALPLTLHGTSITPESFSVMGETALTLDPGAKTAFEVHHEPPKAEGAGLLTILSDDPDQPEVHVPLDASESDRISVGESLTEEFGFLDPSGELSALEGQVTILAYFALF